MKKINELFMKVISLAKRADMSLIVVRRLEHRLLQAASAALVIICVLLFILMVATDRRVAKMQQENAKNAAKITQLENTLNQYQQKRWYQFWK